LSEKTEFQGLLSKRICFAVFFGLAVFLVTSFFVINYKEFVLGNSLISFCNFGDLQYILPENSCCFMGKKDQKNYDDKSESFIQFRNNQQ